MKSEGGTESEVVGIEGYREFDNKYYKPYFVAEFPSNWTVSEYPLREAEGRWISFRGPLDQASSRFTSLDIYLIARQEEPVYESLNSYVEYRVTQESIGDTEILLDESISVSGEKARVVRLSTDRTLVTDSGIKEVTLVKQMAILFKDEHVLVVIYESPKDAFEQYLEVYERLVSTLNLK